jgi:very-short-patch-repair endonuclease
MSSDLNLVDSRADEVESDDTVVDSILVAAEVARCVNYASWQNSVPLLRSLEIRNGSSEVLCDIRLDLETSPSFTRKKSWIVQQVRAGESLAIRDRDIQLDPGYLNGLNEAERGLASFRLYQGDRLLAEDSREIRILARDEWGGMQSMGELLAAFVMPNDPALAPILKKAGDILAQHGHSSALDGYQSHDPKRAYLLTAAIWSAVAAESLTYANPPRSFEQVGQKIRRPATLLADSLATCLDSTLLFAAAIEAVGLNSAVIMVDGHSFAGAWLVERTFNRLIETDCGEVRKAIAAKEFITFETTLVTHRPPARFEDAISDALEATRERQESTFVAAIDIARARMSQIRPLASHAPISSDSFAEQTDDPLPLSAASSLGDMPAEEVEEKPNTPAGRIDRWQRKLLDLSLRNRLLNFKLNKQSVPILCPDASSLEDRLASGAKLRITSLPEQNPLGDRDAELHRRQTKQDLDIEFARQALQQDEISCPISSSDLQGRLTTLYRNVRNDLAEGGSNTLFLAIGFLKWRQNAEDQRIFRAPLLLVPVKLNRSSAISPYCLLHHEDDVRFNATLIQLLKKDFGCDISMFETDLPTDASGVDVPRVMERMRKAVRDIPGFEVVDETALASFSFAKYLMWKDLVDRVGQLENNRVVRHLIHDPDKPFAGGGASGGIPDPCHIDVQFEPKEIFHPLPADSSQLAAVMAASGGSDFVLVGPPGTGKSQTIANIISQCLATRRTVLFVAEKTAALDVVYRRLRAKGLGDCCLELHSNRAERRRFLDQLEASWLNNRRVDGSQWLAVSERLKIRRDELNAYVAAIHVKHANGWNVFEALGTAVRGAQQECPCLEWPDSVQHDRQAFQSLTKLIDDAALTFGVIDPSVRLPMVRVVEWSASWEAKLLTQCDRLRAAAANLEAALNAHGSAIGLPELRDGSFDDLASHARLAKALLASAGDDVRIIFHKQFAKLPAAATELRRTIELFREAQSKAGGTYDEESLQKIPLEELDLQWRKAGAAFWPMSWFAKRKVVRLMQSYASAGAANPASDIDAVRIMRRQLEAVNGNLLAGQTPRWKHLETDVEGLQTHLQNANELRQAILGVGQSSDATNQITKAIQPALKGTAANTPILESASAFLRVTDLFLSALRDYTEAAGISPVSKKSASIASDAIRAADYVKAHRTLLQRWTAWCEVKKRAAAMGLTPFIVELESGRIKPEQLAGRFRVSYARWWLPLAIDCNSALRGFQRFKHEEAISDFCKIDELARATASVRAREAIAHELPAPDGVPRQSELGLLRHQMSLKRPSKSIREVIGAMPETFGKLAPCLLMSPLSIAQYLPVNQAIFDVVIFDEASQITTWDAIGAIARGRQTIIVGDPKQLPPTNFFGRSEDDAENEELEDHEKDLESILDEAQASGLPTLQLNWHYRSRHESLIAFSNWHYYGNKLVTFPAAESTDRGVSLHYMPQNVYDRGKSRTNRDEATAIVADAVARMRKCLQLPESERPTFGVITFNSQQQSLIEDLFDQAQRDFPELDWYFSDDRIEPTAVKNLENVQGDERDVMFFSITFGPDSAGKIPLTFGALNRDGGERRLNVAVTRARQELVVFSSFKGDQLNAERSEKRGVRDLKNFLEYAEKGPIALAARTEGSIGGFDSPFEEAVAETLAAKGWQVVPQVGVSGFRVDLGIVHPDKPGAYLAGVECDGATYHRAAAARDRDKTRQQVLENLGWNIIRIWSPDWWYDPASATQRVDETLNRLLRDERAKNAGLVEALEPRELNILALRRINVL